MALYSIGASWNPDMSRYNRSIKRSLAGPGIPGGTGSPGTGLHGIRGLNFAYRLNTWGPKTGPAMLPANTFRSGHVSDTTGLASPFTWVQGLLGLESAQGMISDAAEILQEAAQELGDMASLLRTIISQAGPYGSVSDAAVQAKAQAVQAEAAGLTSALSNLQSAYNALQTEISVSQGNASLTKDAASVVKDGANGLLDHMATFKKSVSKLEDHLQDLIKTANSGPSLSEGLSNAAIHSVSTLTWLVGGGALVYFLAPTFIPRLVSGIRKSRA